MRRGRKQGGGEGPHKRASQKKDSPWNPWGAVVSPPDSPIVTVVQVSSTAWDEQHLMFCIPYHGPAFPYAPLGRDLHRHAFPPPLPFASKSPACREHQDAYEFFTRLQDCVDEHLKAAGAPPAIHAALGGTFAQLITVTGQPQYRSERVGARTGCVLCTQRLAGCMMLGLLCTLSARCACSLCTLRLCRSA